jgi:tRNA wybutosine-synthesizing protein 4
MHTFYRDYLSSDEHQRIDQLEPFDEIEEWQTKCAHYILLFGLRTSEHISQTWFERMMHDFPTIIHCQRDPLCSLPLNHTDKQLEIELEFEMYPTKMTYAQRFGHQSLFIDDKHVWTLGGFGTVDGRHRRLKTIEVLNIDTGDIQRLDDHSLGRHTDHVRSTTHLSLFIKSHVDQLNCFY